MGSPMLRRGRATSKRHPPFRRRVRRPLPTGREDRAARTTAGADAVGGSRQSDLVWSSSGLARTSSDRVLHGPRADARRVDHQLEGRIQVSDGADTRRTRTETLRTCTGAQVIAVRGQSSAPSGSCYGCDRAAARASSTSGQAIPMSPGLAFVRRRWATAYARAFQAASGSGRASRREASTTSFGRGA